MHNYKLYIIINDKQTMFDNCKILVCITEQYCIQDLNSIALLKQKAKQQQESNSAMTYDTRYIACLPLHLPHDNLAQRSAYAQAQQSTEHDVSDEIQFVTEHSALLTLSDKDKEARKMEFSAAQHEAYNSIMQSIREMNESIMGVLTPQNVRTHALHNNDNNNMLVFKVCTPSLYTPEDCIKQALQPLQQHGYVFNETQTAHTGMRALPVFCTQEIQTTHMGIPLPAFYTQETQTTHIGIPVLPVLCAQQHIYIGNNTGSYHSNEHYTTLAIQIQCDGTLRYIEMCSDHNPRKHETLLQKYTILPLWTGRIQQIDYQCLYSSLDALFAVVYANTDIKEYRHCQGSELSTLHRMFHSMQFHDLKEYKVFSPEANQETHPRVPLLETYKHNNCGDNMHITELTHMSVLLNAHKQLLNAEDTFAYELATALISDLINLWSFREQMMPTTQEYDVFEYGVIITVQDVLPYDYMSYPNIISVPYELQQMHLTTQCTQAYIQHIFTIGTYEMCTWAHALECLKGAIRLSLKPEASSALLESLEDMQHHIAIRFAHFCNKESVQMCNMLSDCGIHLLAGGAMPLFCMVICNIMSLSYSLQWVADIRKDSITLNKDKVIHIYK